MNGLVLACKWLVSIYAFLVIGFLIGAFVFGNIFCLAGLICCSIFVFLCAVLIMGIILVWIVGEWFLDDVIIPTIYFRNSPSCPKCGTKMDKSHDDWWCEWCEESLSTIKRKEVSGEDNL